MGISNDEWLETLDDWSENFLTALEQVGTISGAAREAGVPSRVVRIARSRFAWFDTLCRQAIETVVDGIEEKAFEQARAGESVSLTKFMLKSHRPETYNQAHNVNVSGTLSHHHTVTHEQRLFISVITSDERLNAMAIELAEERMKIRRAIEAGEHDDE